MPKFAEMPVGAKYGMLTIVEELERVGSRRYFLWKCDCGNTKKIDMNPVRSGNTKSCGCMLKKYVKNQPKGVESYNWKGGKIEKEGYVLVYKPDHPNAKSNGYIGEHRYVMSEHLGRPLSRDENVHHINGDKKDNRLGNLELWNTSQPCGQRVEDKIKWAKEILERYDK